MTNREAIKVIEWIKNTHPERITCEALTLAIAALEQQEKDRWIPVTERLPKEDCECRVTEGDFKYVFDCHWNNHKKHFEVWSHYQDGYLPITNVTAWKLKEAPYTEEKHEQS